MNLNEVTRLTPEKFRERSASKRVVLLYPWTTYRTLFISYFLENVERREFWYHLIPEETDKLRDWLSWLVDDLDAALRGFGKNLREALPNADPSQLGEALAADVRAARSGPVVLLIDELDKVPLDSDFRAFITALVANLPDGAQLAICSRRLGYQPWYDMIQRGDAVVLGTERRRDDAMFRIEEVSKPRLEVYAFGSGYALVNGAPITNWDGALPRNLFFFFMDRPLVTRDEIFATFWPDLPVKEATNVFHVTKRKISERIGLKIEAPGSYELTQYSGGFYLPSTKLIRHYDVFDFQEDIEKAMVVGNGDEEEKLLSRAIELYKEPYLCYNRRAWVRERRKNLSQLNAQALIGLGRINNRRQDYERALGFFSRALRETPEREDIHREVMVLYRKMGRIHDARRQFEQLSRILQETLNISPSRETRELLEQIEAET